MITVQIEKFAECVEESKQLQSLHWAEMVELNQMPMNIDYYERTTCEATGTYVYATARHYATLVGHCGWFIRHSNLTNQNYGMEDMIYILRPYRSQVLADALWKTAEKEVIRRGVRDLRLRIPNTPAMLRVWRRWHYNPTTVNVSRFITEEQANEILA